MQCNGDDVPLHGSHQLDCKELSDRKWRRITSEDVGQIDVLTITERSNNGLYFDKTLT